VLWGGRRTTRGATFEPLTVKGSRPVSFAAKDSFEMSLFPIPAEREKEREKEERRYFEAVWHTFFEAAIMMEAKRHLPACQRRRVSCQGVNVTGRATRGVPGRGTDSSSLPCHSCFRSCLCLCFRDLRE
jgi:hypothetical protein